MNKRNKRIQKRKNRHFKAEGWIYYNIPDRANGSQYKPFRISFVQLVCGLRRYRNLYEY